jgi:hypothetical protein
VARKVTTPKGVKWKVRRLLVPDAIRPRFLDPGGQLSPDLQGVVGAEALAVVVIAILFLLVAPLLIPIAVAGKLLLRRPWYVEAKTAGAVTRWRVPRWSETGRVVDEVARALEQGVAEPKPRGAERVTYWGRMTKKRRRQIEDAEQGFYPREY